MSDTTTTEKPTAAQCTTALRLGLTPEQVRDADNMMRAAGINLPQEDQR